MTRIRTNETITIQRSSSFYFFDESRSSILPSTEGLTVGNSSSSTSISSSPSSTLSWCLSERGNNGYWYDDPHHSRQTFYLHKFESRAWYSEHSISSSHDHDHESNYSISNIDNTSAVGSYAAPNPLSPNLKYHGIYPGNRYNWYDHTVDSTSQRRSHRSRDHPNDGKTRDGHTRTGDGDGLPSCRPIQILSKKLFCHITYTLNIRRIIFVGDSLSLAQSESFMRLIGYDGPSATFERKEELSLNVICNNNNNTNNTNEDSKKYHNVNGEDRGNEYVNGDGNKYTVDNFYTVSILFFRGNLGPNIHNNTDTNKHGSSSSKIKDEWLMCGKNEQKGIGSGGHEYCPWHLVYNSTSSSSSSSTSSSSSSSSIPANQKEPRTLLVVNQGAHFYSLQTFKDSYDRFIEIFQNLLRSNDQKRDDIIVFRSTVPGHKDCQNRLQTGINPTKMTYEKFMDRYSTRRYDWNLFDEYNQYAKKKLIDELSPMMARRHNIQYLNVYNMTVLRPDQHRSVNDCLHYVHPGPIDFWNHLLFTNQLDMTDI